MLRRTGLADCSPPMRHCEILIVDCAAFCLSMNNGFHTMCGALQCYSNSYNNEDVMLAPLANQVFARLLFSTTQQCA